MTRRTDRRKEAELFGAAVRKRREAAGLSQERSPSRRMSQRYLRAIELGDNSPSLTAIFQLREALDVTPAGPLEEVWKGR